MQIDMEKLEIKDQPVASQTRFASIGIHESDKLRLLNFTDTEVQAIKNIVDVSWHKPVQATRSILSAQEFKLAGRPWFCEPSSDDAIASRVLVRALLAYLFSRGWILSLPTGISSKQTDCDTLIFREQPTSLPKSEWLAIVFAMDDHLSLIGAPHELIQGFQAVLCNLGLVEEESEHRNLNDFKLHGHPWRQGDEESVQARMLLLMLLETLEKFGWSLYASLKHNYCDPINGNKKDSWYCVRRLDWVPGMPVFHR